MMACKCHARLFNCHAPNSNYCAHNSNCCAPSSLLFEFKKMNRYIFQQSIRGVSKLVLKADSNPPVKNSARYNIPQNNVSPGFINDKIPESLLSLSVQSNVITYLRMTHDLRVTHWSTLKLFSTRPQPRHRNHALVHELVWEAVQLLPNAPLYLLADSARLSPVNQTASSFPAALSHCRIEATLMTLLNTQDVNVSDRIHEHSASPESHLNYPSAPPQHDQIESRTDGTTTEEDEDGVIPSVHFSPNREDEEVVVQTTGNFKHKVYKPKASAVGRYFNIYVAGQRISCIDVAGKLIGGHDKGKDGPTTEAVDKVVDNKHARVLVPFIVGENFHMERHRATKDQMGYCLLQALYFYKQLLGPTNKLKEIATTVKKRTAADS